MLLAVDVGNSAISAGVMDAEHHCLLARCDIPTHPARSAQAYAQWLRSALPDAQHVEGAVLASVVPQRSHALLEALATLTDGHVLEVRSGITGLPIKLEVAEPEKIGVDRVVNACEAWKRFGYETIIVDMGTATTIDVLSEDGALLGGVILPGAAMWLRALHQGTAQLPDVQARDAIYPHPTPTSEGEGGLYPLQIQGEEVMVDPSPLPSPRGRGSLVPSSIGRDTTGAIQAGLHYGYPGMLSGVLEAMRRERPKLKKIIATGGLAGVYAKDIPAIDHVIPELTLLGMATIYRHVYR